MNEDLTINFPILLKDEELIEYFKSRGRPLPFSVSTMRKDRMYRKLGIPYCKVGGQCLYRPSDIENWLINLPIANAPAPTIQKKKSAGAPTRSERLEAQRLGITVKQLRANTNKRSN